uniref:Uncharacterized protein n=1 Tax=Siphoviridae sp. ctNEy24 TaxID=2825466 RepID=A0A8S5U0L6_9CAUD|nr:MAG TPA: hypothetical protein [Siphoviridae sp. ctNEy24]
MSFCVFALLLIKRRKGKLLLVFFLLLCESLIYALVALAL